MNAYPGEMLSMKRTFALILAALAAAALFGALVHAVLVAAHVSEPAATTGSWGGRRLRKVRSRARRPHLSQPTSL